MDPVLLSAARAALDTEQMTGLPARLTMAQWADESGWGKHSPSQNCFGITAYEGCFGKQMLATTEYLGNPARPVRVSREFATFPTIRDCFVKHAELLTSSAYYAGPWQMYQKNHDLSSLIVGIAKHYATDPGYSTKLLSLVKHPLIVAAIVEAARGESA